jgi:hypothetical protein
MKYYSKRELYALGEALGDSVTEHKVGGRIYGGGGKGGGGGGAPPPAPSSQTVTNTSIPEYARPYVEEMLGKAQALTDINQNPYQTYGGERIAGFNPAQQKAFENVQNMQTAPQIGQGSGLAAASGLGSINTAGQLGQVGQQYANQATNPYAQQAYMSPYIQNALQPQLAEMNRQYGITGAQQMATAAGRGAFGGSREALMRSENERNKNMAMNAAIGSGYQNAFQAAQQAQQFGAGLGLQGLQGQLQGYGQANQAAGTLGQLGQTQYGQQMGINQAQQQVGAIQQAQAQQGLDTAYQDFLKQKNYPYQQLAFMSDMTRGLPLSQTSQAMYSAPPSAVSQLGGLGMSALGIYGMSGGFKGAKEGGLMAAKAYKEGGLAYASGGDIAMMDVNQLTEMLDNPTLSPQEVEMIEKRIMLLNRIAMNPESDQIMAPALGRSGIASIGTGDMVPDEMAAGAGGGIVAFADRGVVNLKNTRLDDVDARRKVAEDRLAQSFKNLYQEEPFKESKKSEEETRAAIAESKRMNPYAALTNAGFALMKGSSDPTKRGNFLSELGEAGEAGLGTYGRGVAEQRDLNKLLSGQIEKRETSKYGRDVAMHNALQGYIGQLDAKDLGKLNANLTAQLAASGRETTEYNRAENNYRTAIQRRIDSLIRDDKNKAIYEQNPKQIEREAEEFVRRNTTARTLKILGIDPEAPVDQKPDPKAGDKGAPGVKPPPPVKKVDTSQYLPMPKTAADAVVGKVYNTARGPAKWDGKQFIPIDR